MNVFKKSYSKNEFRSLQTEFSEQLPERISLIEELWSSVVKNNDNKHILKQLHHTLLRLANAGGTYGANEVSFYARKLDMELKPLLDESESTSILVKPMGKLNEWFAQLKLASKEWSSSELPEINTVKVTHQDTSKLVYVLLGDKQFSTEICSVLNKFSYNVKLFNKLNSFELGYKEESPAVIIVDVDFIDGDIAGVNIVSFLKNQIKSCVPIIYISNSSESNLRLEAVRAGADRYFSKPVSMNKIIHTIKGLNSNFEGSPSRVMIVDNDLPLLECYEIILSEAGLITEAVNNPMLAYDLINKFKPDVIIIDMYMPECSGTELVNMIRQDDRWALIPVIFLSAEQDINNQLEALSLGADDFLVKPVHANKLVATINATAIRARKNNKLQQDLKNTLRENKYQLVTLDQHAIVSVADVAGRIIHVNDKLCEISGYSREELMGHNHRMLKSDYHDEEFFKDLWNTIASGNVWHGVICNYNKTGNEYWVDSTIVPFIDDKGKPYKYVSIRTDMTDVRISEQRLQRSHQFANIGAWDWNVANGDLHWSDQIWPLFGYDKKNVTNSYDHFIEAIHPDDRKRVIESVNKCVENGDKYDIEHRVIWPDGSVHWLHESGDVVRNKLGIVQHMLGVVQDITARVKTEDKLRESEEKYRLLFEHSEDPMWVIVGEQFMLTNEASAKMLGYNSVNELTNTHPSELSPEYQPDGQLSFDKANEMMAIAYGEGYHRFEWMHKNKKGDVFPVEVSLTRIPYQGEKSLFCVWRDITTRKVAEQAMIEAREDAENANLAKSQFLSSMSHELRTPMNAILGFSQLLKITKSQPLTKTQEQNVDEVVTAGKHLMNLINDVLDLSKIEAGHIELSNSSVKLSKVLIESMNLITPLALKRGIEVLLMKNGIKIELGELINQTDLAYLDATRFKQVILNLLSNAVKYNKENGKITLSYDLNDNDIIRISIQDTGNGLTKEQLADLFKAFNRLGMESSGIDGTGIGLVITKKIVELMGGEIGLESEVGVGSTSWIELPRGLKKITAENMSSNDNQPSMSSLLENNMGSLKDKRSVLYIEDNPANLRLVEQILGRVPNLHMWSAPEPLLGLELAMEHLPDLILLDINLPGMNGFEVLKKLRSHDKSKEIPVVAISANVMPADIEKGEEAGFDDYVTKPIDVKKLLNVIHKNISNKSNN